MMTPPSAWRELRRILLKRTSENPQNANFALTAFSEGRLQAILRSVPPDISTWHTRVILLEDATSTPCLLPWRRCAARGDEESRPSSAGGEASPHGTPQPHTLVQPRAQHLRMARSSRRRRRCPLVARGLPLLRDLYGDLSGVAQPGCTYRGSPHPGRRGGRATLNMGR